MSCGDFAALGHVLERHVSIVHGLARAMLREGALAEEVTREAFMALWRQSGELAADPAPLPGWLLAVAYRTALERIADGAPTRLWRAVTAAHQGGIDEPGALGATPRGLMSRTS